MTMQASSKQDRYLQMGVVSCVTGIIQGATGLHMSTLHKSGGQALVALGVAFLAFGFIWVTIGITSEEDARGKTS